MSKSSYIFIGLIIAEIILSGCFQGAAGEEILESFLGTSKQALNDGIAAIRTYFNIPQGSNNNQQSPIGMLQALIQ